MPSGHWIVAVLIASGACRTPLPPEPQESALEPVASKAAGLSKEASQDSTSVVLTEPSLFGLPYLEGPARQALLERNFVQAEQLFVRLADAGDRKAELLLAESRFQQGEFKEAAPAFADAAIEFPLLSEFLHLRAGTSFLHSNANKLAIVQAQLVASSSVFYEDAVLVLAEALTKTKKLKMAISLLKKHLKTATSREDEAKIALANAFFQTGARAKAKRQYREVAIKWPTTEAGELATGRLNKLLTKKSKKYKKRFWKLSENEALTRGLAYFEANRNPEAASDLKKARTGGKLDRSKMCIATYHEAESWWKERNRTKAVPLFLRAKSLCRKAKNDALSARSTYQAGRSYMRLGKDEKAITEFREVEELYSNSSLADDARLRRAESLADMEKFTASDEVYLSIPTAYPKGDIGDLGLWRVAFRAFREERFTDTVSILLERKKLTSLENHWKFEGQTDYWLGRAYSALGKTDDARRSYKQTVASYPMTYYALLALNRLRETGPDTFTEVVEALKVPGPAPLPISIPDDFKDRREFLSAVEMAKFGFGHALEKQLVALGFSIPGTKREVTDAKKRNRLWLQSELYAMAGRYDKSHWVTRWHLVGYKRNWPAGPNVERWMLAYPKAFWQLLSKHADIHNHPRELQIAFVREESAFDPLLESWANAIGLTQMIFPTARDHAGDIQVTRENLQNPEKNVTIGSRFLAGLLKKFDGQIGLAVTGYNAGASRARKWRKAIGTKSQDVFTESIPGDQARGYTKRVIGSYFAYSYLYNRTIPTIPLRFAD